MVIRGVILGLNACFWHLEVHFDRYRVHHNTLHDVPNVNVGRSNRLTRFRKRTPPSADAEGGCRSGVGSNPRKVPPRPTPMAESDVLRVDRGEDGLLPPKPATKQMFLPPLFKPNNVV